MLTTAIVIIGSLILSFAVTYLARWSARTMKVYDHPDTDDPSKYHDRPIPLLGGLGVFVPMVLFGGLYLHGDYRIMAILAGTTVMTVLGVVDDIRGLGYGVRLVIQTVVSVLLVELVFRPDFFGPVWLSHFIAVVWMVGLTNAFNLMDNLDGAAGGITGLIALTVLLFANQFGLQPPSLMAAVVVGASLGFTYFNRQPASIYLGSAGSFGLGFLLSCLIVLIAGAMPPGSIRLAALPVIMGFPIFDTTLVVGTRLYRRRPLLTHDASCVTYRFFQLGLNRRQAVRLEYTMTLCFCLLSWFVFTARTPLAHVAFVAWLVVLSYLGYRLATLPGERRTPA
jgi:UDP-GlcNAc:undecaprenyl-phosphate GlcNAc-1-phosphate transferase